MNLAREEEKARETHLNSLGNIVRRRPGMHEVMNKQKLWGTHRE